MDITSFRRDISVKYPTFAPSSSTTISVPNDRLADGMKPLPQRPNYHTTDLPDTSLDMASAPGGPGTPAPHPSSLPQPGTPAPTPPGSPAPKKKSQYQTDPTRPYVFPFSRHGRGDPSSLVPFAIAEADRLYHQHAYVSTGLYQMWQAREECLREERGLGPSGLIGFDRLVLDDEVDEAEEEAMRREWRYEEEEMECAARGDGEGEARAREKRETARRLYRVEIIYVSDSCAHWCLVWAVGSQMSAHPCTRCQLERNMLTMAEGDPAHHAALRDRAAQAFTSDGHRSWSASPATSSSRWSTGTAAGSRGNRWRRRAAYVTIFTVIDRASIVSTCIVKECTDRQKSTFPHRHEKKSTWHVIAKSPVKPYLRSSFCCSSGSRRRTCSSTIISRSYYSIRIVSCWY